MLQFWIYSVSFGLHAISLIISAREMVFAVLDLSLPTDESGETKFKIDPQLAELSSLKLYLQPPHSTLPARDQSICNLRIQF
jgi:hypothetical protein